ncbi:conserved hypothetical protein [Pectobacterium atrosepticum SCRI1043]|uniref:Uncharacterized protein n=1 Tax=Pectobacterium atrosepticum (strain SCRI 1043 / ATCC BAA-672) TaxID=218491 RepID=Q6D0W4_PECAS|nr:hypothetical protein EV46_18295 [Pectobacterium atrosepticum]KFX24508.1 hypothetical protein KP24_10540 [Pectobacterium atrosepticum]PWD56914.1 hypothetical protein DF214_15595 [Pectobacterium atrosepticum]CAG76583.1 conserved hypothetical protein [Pectobacterium atrosepticum SCRI1043]
MFLSCLYGSEQHYASESRLQSFLSYLHGSELNCWQGLFELKFLSYLHGSELLNFHTNNQIIKENMLFLRKTPFLLKRPTAINNQ